MGTHPIFESDFDCLTEMEPDETNALHSLLLGIGANEYYESFVKEDITAELLPYLTKADLLHMSIPPDQLEPIYSAIKCLRPLALGDMDAPEVALFEGHSLRLDSAESTRLYDNCVEQVKYLSGVVQHIKRQVRGFNGQKGLLEKENEHLLEKSPAEMITAQTRAITALIDQHL